MDFGLFQLTKDVGYSQVKVQGISKKGLLFGTMEGILICGEAVTENTVFVRDANYGGGRQGANDHLWPDGDCPKCLYTHFYNEMYVTKGQDVQSTYFMVNGFGVGYSGMQVNGPDLRKLLFSIWSPVKSSNSKDMTA